MTGNSPNNLLHNRWQIGTSLTLRSPIVQATLGSCDGPRLAAAISRAGALGCLTVHQTPEGKLRRQLKRMRVRTVNPVLISFTGQWQRDSILDTCLTEGFRHFQVFWWNGPRLARQIKKAGGTAFWQVGDMDQAEEAMECGADILVAQGNEAGGPVRSPFLLRDLVKKLRALTDEKVPIIASGGLADASDVTEVLSYGATAAMLGTRFLLSEESSADSRAKARLLRATTSDLILDSSMVGEWPCSPRRRLITALNEDSSDLFAGCGISKIHSILPAAEIVRRLTPYLPDHRVQFSQ